MLNQRTLAFLILVIHAAGLSGVLPSLLATATGTLALFWFPGALFAAILRVPAGPRGLTAAALAPVFAGGVLAAALWLGLDSRGATHALILATGCGVLLLPSRPAPEDAHDSDGLGALPWLTGFAFAGLVIAVAVINPGRLLASDAWFHTAVVHELDRAGLPVQDPYFAGLPLQYFWFYHVVVLALVHAAGVTPPVAMPLLAAWAVWLTIPAAAAVARTLGGSRTAGVWAGLMVLLGMGGLYGVFLPIKLARALTGEVQGTAELSTLFRLTPFTVPTAETFVQILFSSSFFLRKYLVATAVPWALVLSLVGLNHGFRWVREGGGGRLVALGVCGAGAVLFHVVLGGAWLAAFAAGAGLTAIRFRSGRAILVALAAVIAAAACAPYVRGLTAAKEADNLMPVGFHLIAVLSMGITLTGVGLLAISPLRHLIRERSREAFLFVGFLGVCLAGAVIARLPGPNQFDKPPIIAFLPLALAAGLAVPAWWSRLAGHTIRRGLFAVAMVLFLVPENAFFIAAYLHDPGRPDPAAAERTVLDWIGEQTGTDAVFLDSNDRIDVLVWGPRRQYWGLTAYADQWGYDREEMTARRRIRDTVFGSGKLTAADRTRLTELGVPVYVITREADAPGAGARLAALPGYRLRFEVPGIRVFQIVPG